MAKQSVHELEEIMERVSEVVWEIEDARKAKGIGVTEMCRNAGIAVFTYYHWLEGLTSPSLASLLMVLEQLDLEITFVNKGPSLRSGCAGHNRLTGKGENNSVRKGSR